MACGLGGSTNAAGGFGGVACDLGGTTGTAGGLGGVAGICGFGGVAGVTISFGGASVEEASGFLTAAASLMGEGVLRDWDAAGEDDCLGGGELSGGGTVTGPNGLLLLGALFVAGVEGAADVSGFFTSTAAAVAAFGLEWLLLRNTRQVQSLSQAAYFYFYRSCKNSVLTSECTLSTVQ